MLQEAASRLVEKHERSVRVAPAKIFGDLGAESSPKSPETHNQHADHRTPTHILSQSPGHKELEDATKCNPNDREDVD